MTKRDAMVLVLGATGQQGGAAAAALRGDGWRVRALVRDPESPKARALAAAGVELARGDLRDRASLEAALRGAHGVFSVQPSSGQPEYGVSDDDEERFGVTVADAARAAGVKHLVYTSVAGLAAGTGVGHFESKWRIEEHIRASGIAATILRPATFMEIFLMPHFGLAQGAMVFFVAPGRTMQFIAVEDIGAIAAHVFAEPAAHVGKTLEIAGDTVTGNDIASKIARATSRSISYAQFPPAILTQNDTLRRLVELVDDGALAGTTDIGALRKIHPGLLTFDAWLEKRGKAAITRLFELGQAG